MLKLFSFLMNERKKKGKIKKDKHFLYHIYATPVKRIQNPIKHLRWSFLQKELATFRRIVFLQKAPY